MKKRVWLLIVALIVAAGCGAFGKWYLDHHFLASGKWYSRDAATLDVRGVSPYTYDIIRGEMPDCDILWELPFQGQFLPLDTTSVTVQSLSDADVQLLDYLTELHKVDASGCTDYPQLTALSQKRPELEIVYRVRISGENWFNDSVALEIPNADPAELTCMLPLLPEAREVSLTGKLPEAASILELCDTFPDIHFIWEVELGGTKLDNSVTSLKVSAVKLPDIAELIAKLAYLPKLSEADLRDCGLTESDFRQLEAAYPDCFFPQPVVIRGLTVQTDDREIDLSGLEMESVDEIESLLPRFPYLEKVIMSDCGFSDEEMDALNQRNEVRFVWTVNLGGLRVRTDDTYFIPVKYRKRVETKDLYALRYCTDMISIDIGHMWVHNCDWAAFMPNLKYLVLGETFISDLTPLSGLKNLVFLELFTIPVTDYSPLVGCTGLEDLNLGKTYCDPTPISKMTWLKNLWWFAADGVPNKPSNSAPELLAKTLPNTTMKFRIEHPTSNGWRKLPNYYAMRDAMDMFYLDQ